MFKFFNSDDRNFKKKIISHFHGQNCEFLADHPILKTVSLDLLESFKDIHFPKAITFYVGAHRSFSGYWSKKNIRIAIQTEQFYDSSGRKLWSFDNGEVLQNIKISLKNCDVFWDLSKDNARFYEENELDTVIGGKGVFGPYVFKKNYEKMRKIVNPHLVFYGTPNDRRNELIKEFKSPKVQVLKRIYGDRLNKMIDQSAGVLNLHFEEGTYTELPRVLSAYNRRRVLVSETLAAPFVSLEHYLPLDGIGLSNADKIFNNFSALVADEYNFEILLKEISF